MTKVFVIDSRGETCLPCHPARARKLISSGKAVVKEICPFTIQLNYPIDGIVGSFTVGIDDGAKEVGIAVVNEFSKEVVFRGTIRLRQDVKKLMEQRSMHRRARRQRNLRYREKRFLNRGQKNFIPPTISQKKNSICRLIDFLRKRLTISKIIVEQGQFDISSMNARRKLESLEYQFPQHDGENFRAKVLWRDKHTCQRKGCLNKTNLRAHHIIFRSNGGTDTPNNGITLCETCHKELHDGKWSFTGKVKLFRYPAHLQQGKWYLFNRLKDCVSTVKICYGWMTKKWRVAIGLEKSHSNDAISMVCKDYSPKISSKDYLILPRRKKIWENNPTKKCEEKNGFKHFDLIKARHRTKGVVTGSIRSLKERAITMRTSFDDNFPVSYAKSKLLWRFDSLVFL